MFTMIVLITAGINLAQPNTGFAQDQFSFNPALVSVPGFKTYAACQQAWGAIEPMLSGTYGIGDYTYTCVRIN